jgi:hypothetical protein
MQWIEFKNDFYPVSSVSFIIPVKEYTEPTLVHLGSMVGFHVSPEQMEGIKKAIAAEKVIIKLG